MHVEEAKAAMDYLEGKGLLLQQAKEYPDCFGDVDIRYADEAVMIQLYRDRGQWGFCAYDLIHCPSICYDHVLVQQALGLNIAHNDFSLETVTAVLMETWDQIRPLFVPNKDACVHHVLDRAMEARIREATRRWGQKT